MAPPMVWSPRVGGPPPIGMVPRVGGPPPNGMVPRVGAPPNGMVMIFIEKHIKINDFHGKTSKNQ